MTGEESYNIGGHELYEELNMFIRENEGNDDIISMLKYLIEKNLSKVYPTIETSHIYSSQRAHLNERNSLKSTLDSDGPAKSPKGTVTKSMYS